MLSPPLSFINSLQKFLDISTKVCYNVPQVVKIRYAYMALSKEQLKFISAVAELGTPKLASDQLGVGYDIYREWQQDREFRDEIQDAKQFFREGMNETLSVLAKRELLKILLNGITEIATSFKSVCDSEGNVIGQERTVKRTYKGIPSWAIKEALALIPTIEKVMEARAAYNAITPEEIEAVKTVTAEYEKQLRAIGDGKNNDNVLVPEDILSGLQRTLVGG